MRTEKASREINADSYTGRFGTWGEWRPSAPKLDLPAMGIRGTDVLEGLSMITPAIAGNDGDGPLFSCTNHHANDTYHI